MVPPDEKKVIAAILEPFVKGFQPKHWDEAMAARAENPAAFLQTEKISERVKASGLSEDHAGPLRSMAREIASDENLLAFAWYLHWRVFVAPEHGQPWGVPTLEKRLGSRAGLFYQLLSLEWEPRLRAYHKKLGYPSKVTDETLEQIQSYEANHLRGKGGQGMYQNQFPWFATYLMGPYIKLGRFEYQLHAYDGGTHVYRRKRDGAVLLMAESGQRFGMDGLRLDSKAPPAEGWTASLKEEGGWIRGFSIAPTGHALNKEIRLPAAEWSSYLRTGDRVLDLHIPAGGKMDMEAMVNSFKQAGPFFRKHHPDKPWKALVVTTWFMDPRAVEILGPESNPVLLQRLVHLYPTHPSPDSLWFVFLGPVALGPPDQLPATTSMQKKLIDFMKSGRTWHGGGFFMLPEDLADPKLDVYRDRFAALSKELAI